MVKISFTTLNNIDRSDAERMQTINQHYKARLQPVLDHIRLSLDEPLRLEALASKACFSPYHFHRIFKAVMGETVNEHIRRLRMEKAHLLLASSGNLRIVDVATACGYLSQSTFSRDFKHFFSVTPSQLRCGRMVSRRSNRKQEHLMTSNISVHVENFHQIPVISRTRMGAYDFRLGLEWARLILRAKSDNVMRKDSRKIGLIYDDPEITPGVKCRFDTMLTVAAEDAYRILPSAMYAVVVLRDRFSQLGSIINELYTCWLVQSRYYPSEGPLVMAFEENLYDFRSFKLCIPIATF